MDYAASAPFWNSTVDKAGEVRWLGRRGPQWRAPPTSSSCHASWAPGAASQPVWRPSLAAPSSD